MAAMKVRTSIGSVEPLCHDDEEEIYPAKWLWNQCIVLAMLAAGRTPDMDRYPAHGCDPRKRVRIVPMKVLVLGLSRTGTECDGGRNDAKAPTDLTLAIRKALIQLGYERTYHGYEAAVENPRDCELWLEALRAKYDGVGEPIGRAQFDQLLGHYQVRHCYSVATFAKLRQAVCDVPAACFATELCHAYPQAKVILSTRNVDDWHR